MENFYNYYSPKESKKKKKQENALRRQNKDMKERKFNATMNEGAGMQKRLVSDLIYDEFVMINIQYDNKLNLHNCFA